MATLTVQDMNTLAGLNPTYAACAGGGDDFVNTGHEYIHIKNGHSSPQSVTIHSQRLCDQGVEHDVVVSVPNAEERIIGPFHPARFNDANKKVQLTYSGVTALTIAVRKGIVAPVT